MLVSPDEPTHEREILKRSRPADLGIRRQALLLRARPADSPRARIRSGIRDDSAALRAGVNQFKVDFSSLRDWYNGEHWLRRNSLIAVAAGDDGLSGFQRDGAWGAYREEITRFSQILFSGRPGEREFWIGRRSPEDRETVKRLGGFKPCLHGSDAHSIAKLFQARPEPVLLDQGGPDLRGPEAGSVRARGPGPYRADPPLYHDQARVIRAVRLSRSSGWFDDVEIPLNAGLVSIIGQKGSGKSALAEIIAYTGGSWVTDEPGSFLKRAGAHLGRHDGGA